MSTQYFFPVHMNANACQENLGKIDKGTKILIFINDLLCTELLMREVLQRRDERLKVKCMDAERFMGEVI